LHVHASNRPENFKCEKKAKKGLILAFLKLFSAKAAKSDSMGFYDFASETRAAGMELFA
jgi:hypothetical protein